jgi:hypothetical protein
MGLDDLADRGAYGHVVREVGHCNPMPFAGQRG